jgi:hypothetical protein
MASELILILRDFYPSDEPPAEPSTLPRLPALETLLARADRVPMVRGWRDELRVRYATGPHAALSPAALTALGFPQGAGDRGAQHWLATPVHCFAGLDSVQLHPAGLLELPPATQAQLADEFNATFADSPWRLRAIGRRELLLSGAPLEASGEDPAASIGADLRQGLPHGAAGATLRRLVVEIEMWLYEHRLNRERQRQGELPVTGLWLWGASAPAGPGAPAASRVPAAQLLGSETYADALWQLSGGRSGALPERFGHGSGADAAPGGKGSSQLVLYPTMSTQMPNPAFEHLERNWLAPALQVLQAGELGAIELLAGHLRWRLSRLQRLRLWRKPAPWWRAIAPGAR